MGIDQILDARQTWGIDDFIPRPKVPEDLQARWSEIPPEINTLNDHLQPIFDWVCHHTQSGDYLLIQGDVGAIPAKLTPGAGWSEKVPFFFVSLENQRSWFQIFMENGLLLLNPTPQKFRFPQFSALLKRPFIAASLALPL